MILITIYLLALLQICQGLDNGLALTPVMGWMHWERYRCLVDCKLYPDECISEKLFRKTADLMVSEGYLAAGYQYIMIDDCWMSHVRDHLSRLQPNATRFPSGIKALADYVHEKGLKLGIYGDFGNLTCGGYPGSIDYLQLDAQTFADWGVDYLKLDGCYANVSDMEVGYGAMSGYLNQTGRPIVFSCSWPAYMEPDGIKPNYTALIKYCNLWRNWDDIEDSWENVTSIAKWFSQNQNRLQPVAGPGHWNDPDMLIIGNFGLSYEQSKSQMAIWTILAAPLIMSVDLKNMKSEFKEILLDKDIIRINQDPLGIQGLLVFTIDHIDIWTRPIMPVIGKSYTYAIAFVSRRVDGYPYAIKIKLSQLVLNHKNGYTIQDVYEKKELPAAYPEDQLVVRVKPSGAVLLKATPIAT